MAVDVFETIAKQALEVGASTISLFDIKLFGATCSTVIAFFLGCESHTILAGLVALLTFDFITGVGAAYISKEPIESRRALKSATKLLAYAIFISAGYITSNIVPGGEFLNTAITSFLALTELVSIVENIGKMGFATPRRILNQVKELRDSK